jgi:hypothetical protein
MQVQTLQHWALRWISNAYQIALATFLCCSESPKLTNQVMVSLFDALIDNYIDFEYLTKLLKDYYNSSRFCCDKVVMRKLLPHGPQCFVPDLVLLELWQSVLVQDFEEKFLLYCREFGVSLTDLPIDQFEGSIDIQRAITISIRERDEWLEFLERFEWFDFEGSWEWFEDFLE